MTLKLNAGAMSKFVLYINYINYIFLRDNVVTVGSVAIYRGRGILWRRQYRWHGLLHTYVKLCYLDDKPHHSYSTIHIKILRYTQY